MKKVTLKLDEFKELQRVVAVSTLRIQAIQNEAAQKINAEQKIIQKEFNNLLKKYKLRLDTNYSLDEQTHSLVEISQ